MPQEQTFAESRSVSPPPTGRRVVVSHTVAPSAPRSASEQSAMPGVALADNAISGTPPVVVPILQLPTRVANSGGLSHKHDRVGKLATDARHSPSARRPSPPSARQTSPPSVMTTSRTTSRHRRPSPDGTHRSNVSYAPAPSNRFTSFGIDPAISHASLATPPLPNHVLKYIQHHSGKTREDIPQQESFFSHGRSIVHTIPDLYVRCMALVGNAEVWVGDKSGALSRWGAHDAELIQRCERTNRSIFVSCILPVAGALHVWLGQSDGSLRVVQSANASRVVKEVKEHAGAITCMELSHNERFVFSGSQDFTITQWSSADAVRVMAFNGGHRNAVRCLKVVGIRLFSGGDDGRVVEWDPTTGKPLHVLKGHSGGVRCLQASTVYLWSGGDDATIRVWALQASEDEKHTKRPTTSKPLNPLGTLRSEAINAMDPLQQQDASIVTSTSVHGRSFATDMLPPPDCVHMITNPLTACVTRLEVVGSKMWCASLGTIYVWNTVTFALEAQFKEHSGSIAAVQTIRQSVMSRVWSCGAEGNVLLWNVECGFQSALSASTDLHTNHLEHSLEQHFIREEKLLQETEMHREENKSLKLTIAQVRKEHQELQALRAAESEDHRGVVEDLKAQLEKSKAEITRLADESRLLHARLGIPESGREKTMKLLAEQCCRGTRLMGGATQGSNVSPQEARMSAALDGIRLLRGELHVLEQEYLCNHAAASSAADPSTEKNCRNVPNFAEDYAVADCNALRVELSSVLAAARRIRSQAAALICDEDNHCVVDFESQEVPDDAMVVLQHGEDWQADALGMLLQCELEASENAALRQICDAFAQRQTNARNAAVTSPTCSGSSVTYHSESDDDDSGSGVPPEDHTEHSTISKQADEDLEVSPPVVQSRTIIIPPWESLLYAEQQTVSVIVEKYRRHALPQRLQSRYDATAASALRPSSDLQDDVVTCGLGHIVFSTSAHIDVTNEFPTHSDVGVRGAGYRLAQVASTLSDTSAVLAQTTTVVRNLQRRLASRESIIAELEAVILTTEKESLMHSTLTDFVPQEESVDDASSSSSVATQVRSALQTTQTRLRDALDRNRQANECASELVLGASVALESLRAAQSELEVPSQLPVDDKDPSSDPSSSTLDSAEDSAAFSTLSNICRRLYVAVHQYVLLAQETRRTELLHTQSVTESLSSLQAERQRFIAAAAKLNAEAQEGINAVQSRRVVAGLAHASPLRDEKTASEFTTSATKAPTKGGDSVESTPAALLRRQGAVRVVGASAVDVLIGPVDGGESSVDPFYMDHPSHSAISSGASLALVEGEATHTSNLESTIQCLLTTAAVEAEEKDRRGAVLANIRAQLAETFSTLAEFESDPDVSQALCTGDSSPLDDATDVDVSCHRLRRIIASLIQHLSSISRRRREENNSFQSLLTHLTQLCSAAIEDTCAVKSYDGAFLMPGDGCGVAETKSKWTEADLEEGDLAASTVAPVTYVVDASDAPAAHADLMDEATRLCQWLANRSRHLMRVTTDHCKTHVAWQRHVADRCEQWWKQLQRAFVSRDEDVEHDLMLIRRASSARLRRSLNSGGAEEPKNDAVEDACEEDVEPHEPSSPRIAVAFATNHVENMLAVVNDVVERQEQRNRNWADVLMRKASEDAHDIIAERDSWDSDVVVPLKQLCCDLQVASVNALQELGSVAAFQSQATTEVAGAADEDHEAVVELLFSEARRTICVLSDSVARLRLQRESEQRALECLKHLATQHTFCFPASLTAEGADTSSDVLSLLMHQMKNEPLHQRICQQDINLDVAEHDLPLLTTIPITASCEERRAHLHEVWLQRSQLLRDQQTLWSMWCDLLKSFSREQRAVAMEREERLLRVISTLSQKVTLGCSPGKGKSPSALGVADAHAAAVEVCDDPLVEELLKQQTHDALADGLSPSRRRLAASESAKRELVLASLPGWQTSTSVGGAVGGGETNEFDDADVRRLPHCNDDGDGSPTRRSASRTLKVARRRKHVDRRGGTEDQQAWCAGLSAVVIAEQSQCDNQSSSGDDDWVPPTRDEWVRVVQDLNDLKIKLHVPSGRSELPVGSTNLESNQQQTSSQASATFILRQALPLLENYRRLLIDGLASLTASPSREKSAVASTSQPSHVTLTLLDDVEDVVEEGGDNSDSSDSGLVKDTSKPIALRQNRDDTSSNSDSSVGEAHLLETFELLRNEVLAAERTSALRHTEEYVDCLLKQKELTGQLCDLLGAVRGGVELAQLPASFASYLSAEKEAPSASFAPRNSYELSDVNRLRDEVCQLRLTHLSAAAECARQRLAQESEEARAALALERRDRASAISVIGRLQQIVRKYEAALRRGIAASKFGDAPDEALDTEEVSELRSLVATGQSTCVSDDTSHCLLRHEPSSANMAALMRHGDSFASSSFASSSSVMEEDDIVGHSDYKVEELSRTLNDYCANATTAVRRVDRLLEAGDARISGFAVQVLQECNTIAHKYTRTLDQLLQLGSIQPPWRPKLTKRLAEATGGSAAHATSAGDNVSLFRELNQELLKRVEIVELAVERHKDHLRQLPTYSAWCTMLNKDRSLLKDLEMQLQPPPFAAVPAAGTSQCDASGLALSQPAASGTQLATFVAFSDSAASEAARTQEPNSGATDDPPVPLRVLHTTVRKELQDAMENLVDQWQTRLSAQNVALKKLLDVSRRMADHHKALRDLKTKGSPESNLKALSADGSLVEEVALSAAAAPMELSPTSLLHRSLSSLSGSGRSSGKGTSATASGSTAQSLGTRRKSLVKIRSDGSDSSPVARRQSVYFTGVTSPQSAGEASSSPAASSSTLRRRASIAVVVAPEDTPLVRMWPSLADEESRILSQLYEVEIESYNIYEALLAERSTLQTEVNDLTESKKGLENRLHDILAEVDHLTASLSASAAEMAVVKQRLAAIQEVRESATDAFTNTDSRLLQTYEHMLDATENSRRQLSDENSELKRVNTKLLLLAGGVGSDSTNFVNLFADDDDHDNVQRSDAAVSCTDVDPVVAAADAAATGTAVHPTGATLESSMCSTEVPAASATASAASEQPSTPTFRRVGNAPTRRLERPTVITSRGTPRRNASPLNRSATSTSSSPGPRPAGNRPTATTPDARRPSPKQHRVLATELSAEHASALVAAGAAIESLQQQLRRVNLELQDQREDFKDLLVIDQNDNDDHNAILLKKYSAIREASWQEHKRLAEQVCTLQQSALAVLLKALKKLRRVEFLVETRPPMVRATWEVYSVLLLTIRTISSFSKLTSDGRMTRRDALSHVDCIANEVAAAAEGAAWCLANLFTDDELAHVGASPHLLPPDVRRPTWRDIALPDHYAQLLLALSRAERGISPERLTSSAADGSTQSATPVVHDGLLSNAAVHAAFSASAFRSPNHKPVGVIAAQEHRLQQLRAAHTTGTTVVALPRHISPSSLRRGLGAAQNSGSASTQLSTNFGDSPYRASTTPGMMTPRGASKH